MVAVILDLLDETEWLRTNRGVGGTGDRLKAP